MTKMRLPLVDLGEILARENLEITGWLPGWPPRVELAPRVGNLPASAPVAAFDLATPERDALLVEHGYHVVRSWTLVDGTELYELGVMHG